MPKEWAGRPVYSVSELVRLLASELEAAFPDVWVEGEVSSWKRAASGHCYFSLKDDQGALRAVLFRTHAMRLGFEPENGMVVLARGRLSVYEASGDLQLYVTVMEPAGLGALQMAFEQARRRLMEEGLTDPSRKRPIPPFPGRVGVITSLEGAALHDVLSVLRRRGAAFDVVVAPALVQGAQAPASLMAALDRMARLPAAVDILLLTRGGGSMQDLWAFNDEALARRVAAFPVPVISAVGHEVDTVLTDLTADLRAPTPSVAAELLTAGVEGARARAGEAGRLIVHGMQSRLFQTRERFDRCRSDRMGTILSRRLQLAQEGTDRAAESAARAMSGRLESDSHRLALCMRALAPESVARWTRGLEQRRDSAEARLRAASLALVRDAGARFQSLARLLHSLSPLGVLARGYAAAFGADGTPVTSSAQAPVGTALSLALRDGGVDCTVTSSSATQLPAALHRIDGRGPGAVESALEDKDRG